MTIDIIAIILSILLFYRGYQKGIIVALGSVLALVTGAVAAMALSAKLSIYLLEKGLAASWAPLLSYVLLFLLVVWLVRMLARLIEKVAQGVLLGWVNKSIGGLLYMALGLLAYSSLLWLANRAHLLPAGTIVQSMTYSYIAPAAPWVFEHAAEYLPFAKGIMADLKLFFDGVNRQLPEHVGPHR